METKKTLNMGCVIIHVFLAKRFRTHFVCRGISCVFTLLINTYHNMCITDVGNLQSHGEHHGVTFETLCYRMFAIYQIIWHVMISLNTNLLHPFSRWISSLKNLLSITYQSVVRLSINFQKYRMEFYKNYRVLNRTSTYRPLVLPLIPSPQCSN